MGEEKKPKAMRLGDAVSSGIIANETLAYFIGRTWLFFKRIGINPERMRFRQHLLHEVREGAEGSTPHLWLFFKHFLLEVMGGSAGKAPALVISSPPGAPPDAPTPSLFSVLPPRFAPLPLLCADGTLCQRLLGW